MKKNIAFITVLSLICLGIMALIFLKPELLSPVRNAVVSGDHSKLPEVQQLAAKTANSSNSTLSTAVIIAVIAIQLIVLASAFFAIGRIEKRKDGAWLKLELLNTADTYLDLPLYVGLFGTVASFIIISLNPHASRLVAYTSTLIGIIISVNLRVFMFIPLKQRLLKEIHRSGKQQ